MNRWLGALAVVALALPAACAGPQKPFAVPQPGMVGVPRGRFTMGWDRGEQNEKPTHRVFVSAYAVDRTEVSATRFAEFLNAAGNPGERFFTPDDHATVTIVLTEDGREQLFAARPGFEQHPANNVSWHGADAYCRWRDMRLPTEAEWEKAARGTDRRRYPWGRTPPDERTARFGQSWTEHGLEVLRPVDTLPEGASPYELLHMSGNVLEWVNDWYRQNLCDFCNPEGEGNLPLVRQLTGEEKTSKPQAPQQQVPPRSDPTGPATGSFRVLRGGSWQDRDPLELTTSHRFWLDPAQRFPHTGFRCASPLEPPPEPAAVSPAGTNSP